MIKPVDHLTYIYYRCPTCKEQSDEVRMAETLIGKLCCHSCQTIYEIEPIETISFNTTRERRPTKSPKVSPPKDKWVSAKIAPNKNDGVNPQVKQILSGLVSQGYAEEKVQHAFGIVKSRFNKLNKDDLFRELVLLLDETSR